MAPTIQGQAATERTQQRKPAERRSDLVCRVRYANALPDIPFEAKFIAYPFENNRFVGYKTTSLERTHKHDLITEHDLGVTIDLIDPRTYETQPDAVLHPDDERLLEEDVLTPADSKRSRQHNQVVPWLKKTEYISTEFNRYGQTGVNTETKVGYNVKKLFKDENRYMDRDSQIAAINKTFDDAKKPITSHYSKANVVPVDVLPVFPDFDLWRYPFAQVMFDSDPAPVTQIEEMSNAMIRGVMDESGNQFVAYFLPTEETSRKRKRDADMGLEYTDDEEYEYRMAREYNWNVKNKASKGYEENYFFAIRPDGVFYNELETRVRLSKRRLKPGAQPNNSKLVVKHRPLNENEHRSQQIRLMQLEQAQDESDEEEEEEEGSGKEEGGSGGEEEKKDSDEDEDGGGSEKDEVEGRSGSEARSGGEEESEGEGSGGEEESGSEAGSGGGGEESGSEEGEGGTKKKDEAEEIFGDSSSDSEEEESGSD